MTLNCGQKSAIVRQYNAGKLVSEIAYIMGLAEEVIHAFLQTRPGYPGKLYSSKAPRKIELISRDIKPAVASQDRVPVTLPRIRFLEGDHVND